MQRRQMKHLKHASETLAKTPKNTWKPLQTSNETLATNV
jgi:hypothetical protein